jgi:hypothetical protein
LFGVGFAMNGVFGGSVLLAVLTVGVAASAQNPMTPSRPNPPTAGSTSWVEPPPSAKPPAVTGPAAVGSTVPGSTAAAVPAAKPEQQAAREVQQRPVRRAARTSRPSGDSVAARLNRQELSRIRSGSSSGYYRYSPWFGY